jgi:hypothetical protein
MASAHDGKAEDGYALNEAAFWAAIGRFTAGDLPVNSTISGCFPLQLRDLALSLFRQRVIGHAAPQETLCHHD